MNARTWKIAAALCLVAAAAGCKKDEGHSPGSAAPTITLTPSATSVVANGTNAVTLSVTDTGAVAVTVTTDRGTLNGGVTSYVIPAGTGATTATVTLTTCNSGGNVGCAGAATVRATSTSGAATASINFTSLAAACQTNCGADAGCHGAACSLVGGGTGSCTASTPSTCSSAPACTPTAATETSCSGGVDEDCNGRTDCADAACDGQPCDPNSSTSVCVAGACTDLASGLAITVTSDRSRLPANHATTARIFVTVTSGTDPAANMAVTVSTTAGTFGTATTARGTTGKDGTATFTLTAPDRPGVAVITASPDLVPSVSASTTITIPRLGSIQIPAGFATSPVMGVATSGWNEIGGVAVQVLDDRGQPYPDGLAVHFEHRQLGGSTFGAPLGTCAASSPAPCVAYDGATTSPADKPDTEGMATAPILSGTVAGTLAVTATTTAYGDGGATITRAATLPGIAVVGAKASAANFSIQCAPRNVPALAETDCSTSWVDAPFTCAAFLKDRFNNLLGTSTQVIFASEAAAVGQVAWTSAYDPSAQGTGQKDLGTATQIFQTLGAGLPFDVDPQPGEQSVVHALDGCGLRTHNPRDGVVTILAIADGEEAFFDANGNGQYDLGEPFIDQGEPFVDQDDDGAYTPGEWFLDLDGDGAYTPPNGRWDGATKIWTQTIVVYTGWPAPTLETADPTLFLGTRWVDDGTLADACTPTLAPAPFSVESGQTTPTVAFPTSTTYTAVASDMNLNVLATASTYGAKPVPSDVKAKVEYLGLASYADLLGMSYQYWPCEQQGTGACASQCRATGANAPCEMRPAITGYWCGIAPHVRITGGTTEADGEFSIDFLVDTPWQNYGGLGKIMHQSVSISGYSDRNPATPP